MSTSLPDKLEVAQQLLRKGSLFIHLDPRISDVVVPPWLRHQYQLVLQVGIDMPIPIPDLRADSGGIFGTLSFSRTPFTCEVPWRAVFALVGDEGRGMVWPESMPSEVVAEVEREEETAAKRRGGSPTTGRLNELASPAIPPLPRSAITKSEAQSRRKGKPLPPYLRVVK